MCLVWIVSVCLKLEHHTTLLLYLWVDESNHSKRIRWRKRQCLRWWSGSSCLHLLLSCLVWRETLCRAKALESTNRAKVCAPRSYRIVPEGKSSTSWKEPDPQRYDLATLVSWSHFVSCLCCWLPVFLTDVSSLLGYSYPAKHRRSARLQIVCPAFPRTCFP